MSISQSDIDSLLAATNELAAETHSTLSSASAPPPDTTPATQRAQRPASSPSAISRNPPPETHRILCIRVPVIVKLAECDMPVSAILKLTSGSILEFERSADADLELLVNNKMVGSGQAVKVGENFGLRIARICGVEDTIRAMGGD